MHSRVVQIETGAVATEEISEPLMAELSPKGRMFGESGRIFMWYRPTSDGKRFIFGGRMGGPGCSAEERAAATKRAILRVFPQLEDVGISHAWSGDVAYTPDHAPHLGFEDGVWLAGGYCGSGVTRSLYFGAKLARRILGEKDAGTAFDDLPFAKVPFKPFSRMAAELMTRWWSWQDARDLRRRG
jgi:glycine/D-amino acid oxidase-like deaminating enzyme